MIRPYLAVIKDSFREAFASRILVVVLVLITGVLLVAAPLTYSERQTTGIRGRDVPDPKLLADQFTAAARLKNPVAEHLWSLMSKDQQQLVANFKPLKEKPNFRDIQEFQKQERELVKILDDLLKRDDFYDRKAWQDVNQTLEARTLRNDDKLDKEGKARLNRVLLENAFVGVVEPSTATSLQFQFGPYALSEPMPIRKQQFARVVERLLPWLVDKGLLAIGLFIALLVTAPVIPQMFDPGSLHLLLSKPVSRSLLFLSKFVGSCAFVLICAVYLFVGIWLLLGTRLGLWEHQLLWCIPLYVFVFMIYYSVAALAALWWRNTVLSIVAAGLFWGVCFGIGFTKQTLEGPMEKQRIMRLTLAKDSLIGVTGLHMPLEWDQTAGNWRQVCVSEEQEQFTLLLSMMPNLPPPVGPIYDARNDQLIRIGLSFQNGRFAFVSGKRSEGWKYAEGPLALPPNVIITMLNEPDGSVLLLSNLGLFRITGDVRKKSEPPKIFGMSLPFSAGGPMTQLTIEPNENWNNPATAAIDKEGLLAVYSAGLVTVYQRENSRVYKQLAQKRVFEKDPPPAVIAVGGGTVMLASENGVVRLMDAKTLEEIESPQQPGGENPPRGAWISPDGQWLAVAYHTGKLWLREKSQAWKLAPLNSQGDINAVLFTPEGTLLVAHQVSKVTEYELPSGKVLKRFSPPLTMTEFAYRYGILPIYTLCPKPGEFYKTVEYLMTRQETTAAKEKVDNLEAAQVKLNPWSPVWSSALFVAVMLGICCIYIEWQEF